MKDYIRKIKEKNRLNPQNNIRDSMEELFVNDTNLPKGLDVEDIDRAAIETFKVLTDMEMGGKQLKTVSFLSISQLGEQKEMWSADVASPNSLLDFPFCIFVKDAVIQQGTLFGTPTANVPSIKPFEYNKVPKMINGKIRYVKYSIAQPVAVDIGYALHFFTEKLSQLNKFNERILHAFQSQPYIIEVNGHNLYLYFVSTEDNSQISDLEKRRFYHVTHTFMCKAFLLDEDQFQKEIGGTTMKIKYGTDLKNNTTDCNKDILEVDCDECLEFKLTRRDDNSKSFRMKNAFYFQNTNLSTSNDFKWYINGDETIVPFKVKKNDVLTFAHNKRLRRALNIRICGNQIS